MYRTKKLIIRMNEIERAAVDKLAQAERLPASTLARRMLLVAAEKRGLIPPAVRQAQSPEVHHAT